MDFTIISAITHIEPIATGSGVSDRLRLNKAYGMGNWRKLKGVAHIELLDGATRLAEIHWYEAHGIGKR